MLAKCLIVGLGQIGLSYDLKIDPTIGIYSHARAFELHEAFELVGGVDTSPTPRLLFENHYQKPSYSNLTTALKQTEPDVVVIATPANKHNELLDTTLSCRSVKVVICEKPFGIDPKKARDYLKQCDDANIRLFVNYVRRSDPGAIEVKRRIDSGVIAAPLKGSAWYSKGLLNNGSHLINLLQFWLGPVQKTQLIEHGRVYDEYDSDIDVQVQFEHGTVSLQSVWEEFYSHGAIELLSPSGRLRYEQNGETIFWQSVVGDPHFLGQKMLNHEAELINNTMHHYQWSVTDQLANAIHRKSHHLCTGAEALNTLEVINAIRDS